MGVLVQTGNSLGRVSNRIFPRRGRPSTGVRKVSYRRSIIARIDGPSGRVPQGFVRRLRGDPGDRLRAIIRSTSRAALPPLDRGVHHLPDPRPLVARRDGYGGRVVHRFGVARLEPRGPRLALPPALAVIGCRKALNWKVLAGSTLSWSGTRACTCGGSAQPSGWRAAWRPPPSG